MRHDSDQTVYIIVNAIPPYGYEINQFLACPIGTKNVVRFKQKWLPEIADPQNLEGPDILKGKPAVLILRDWETARLIPLRRLTISSVLPVGEIYDIEWIANEIIDYDSEKEKRDRQLDAFNEHMRTNQEKYPNEPRSDLKNLVFLVEVDFTKEIQDSKKSNFSELDRWGKVVDIIGKLDHFLDIDFIKVLSIQDIREKARPLVDSEFSEEKRYLLDSTQSYLLTIYQRTFTKKPRGDSSVTPRIIILKSDTEIIKIIDGESQISGKYGGHRFRFKTRTLRRSIDTYLKLQINRQDDKNVPSIHIPIKIKTPFWLTALRITSLILFIVGSLGLFLADSLFPNYPDFARNLSIFIMIIAGWETRDILYYFVDKLQLTISSQ